MLLNLPETKVLIHMRDIDDLHTKYFGMDQIWIFIRSVLLYSSGMYLLNLVKIWEYSLSCFIKSHSEEGP
jgi:hypothetical protein